MGLAARALRLRSLPARLCSRRPLATSAAAAAAAPLDRPSTRANEHRPATHSFYATCAPGLEAVVAAELAGPDVGAFNVRAARAGVAFDGGQLTGYRAVLWLRSAVRVLSRLAGAELVLQPGQRGGDALYDFVRSAGRWPELLPRGQTFSVEARVWDCEDLPSDALAATRAKDAVCDALRDARGEKPPPPLGQTADLPLFLTCYRGAAVLYRDLCGSSLHKRGYRAGAPVHRAALNESVAAGCLALANWQGAPAGLHEPGGEAPRVLVDPFCGASPPRLPASARSDSSAGSGTLLVEAALMSARVAPGLLRPGAWPLQSWPDFDGALWRAARGEAVAAAEVQRRLLAASPELRPRLFGCDVHAGALGLAEHAVRQSRMGQEGYGWISLTYADLRDWTPPEQPQLVVTNPPWGGRLQGGDAEGEPVEETWFALGTFLKRRCAGARAAVLCGNREAATKLFLPQKNRHPVTVGGIDCRLLLMQMLPPKAAQNDAF